MIVKNGVTISSVLKGTTPIQVIKKGLETIFEAFKKLTVSGKPPLTLEKSVGKDLEDYKIYGESVQDGTPTPETPIEVESVGDYDETTGKYKIPVRVNDTTTNIYLNEPLRKIGDYADYIDYKNQKVVRRIEKRLCGELEWYQHQSYSYIYAVNSARIQSGINPMCDILDSTTYKPADSIRNMTKDFCIKMHATGSALYISDSVHTTEDEFYDFIKDVYIIYVLKTPTEETIELPTIATNNGTSIIDIETDIKPSNLEIEYFGLA